MRAKKLGKAGENFSAKWLRAKGYQIIAQNYHAPGGEIDIIAWCPREKFCLMIEVKTRFGYPRANGIAAINSQKITRMKRAAAHYFFNYLERQYAPDFELWGLAINLEKTDGQRRKLQVVDFLAVG